MKMQNEELEKSKAIRDKYKEYNEKTEEVLVKRSEKLRSWTFAKTKVDPNAVKMTELIKTEKESRKKVLEPKLKKVPVEKKKPRKTENISDENALNLYQDYVNGMTVEDLSKKYNILIRAVRRVVKKYITQSNFNSLKKAKSSKPKKPRKSRAKEAVVPFEIIEGVYQDYRDGLSMKEISDKHHVTHRAIKAVVRDKLMVNGQAKTPMSYDTVFFVKELLDQGFSQKEIAKKLGKKQNTISYHVGKLRKQGNIY